MIMSVILFTSLYRKERDSASVEQAVKDYQNRVVNKDVRSDVIVFRSRVLDSAFRAMTRKSFNPTGQLSVVNGSRLWWAKEGIF